MNREIGHKDFLSGISEFKHTYHIFVVVCMIIMLIKKLNHQHKYYCAYFFFNLFKMDSKDFL